MASLINEFSSVQYLCCTADIWSTKHKSFLGVTVHWIDENTLQHHSKLLCCRRFLSPHDSERVAELLSSIYEEFDITHKVISTVTDNGSNFVKAFKVWGISIEEFDIKHKLIYDSNDTLASMSTLCDEGEFLNN